MNKNKQFIELLPLKTERLVIRETSTKDIDMILKMDKQEVTQKYLGGVKNKTKEERISFLEKKSDKFKEGISSSLTVYLEDKPIGFVELKINDDYNDAEISYIFDLDYCSKGYCTEICKKLIDICFNKLKLNYIYADTVEGNIASEKVLEKLGFKFINSVDRDGVTFKNYKKFNKFKCNVIICGPAIGKTYLADHDEHFVDVDGLRAIYKYGISRDSKEYESGKWNRGEVVNKDSKEYSKRLLQSTIAEGKVALLSFHEDLVNYLLENNIDYCLVYTDIDSREEYIQRMKDRGNQDNFIYEMTNEKVWNEFHKKDEEDEKPTYKIKLRKGEYLSDIKDCFLTD
jgi:ribosomal-protein-alanine N-acetyltransferase